MNYYTVLLLYPNTSQTYMDHVRAFNPQKAVQTAQEACAEYSEFDPDDLVPLLVIDGLHDDLKP